MPIRTVQGDLLHADADALVNTVNCVGVMGKGIALQFKRRYPRVFKAYEGACKRGEVQIGHMFVVATEELQGPQWVVNFPTKVHWRSPSTLDYVRAGLKDLRRWLVANKVKSVAVPPLGAGNGGLDWADVEQMIHAELADLEHVEIYVYAPGQQVRELQPAQRVRMTWGRALLLELLRRYVDRRNTVEPWEDLTGASHLEIQKLMFFADFRLPKLSLAYAPGRYGPYSERVRHLVQDMEGTYLLGFGDGANPVLALDPISPTERGLRELESYLRGNSSAAIDAAVSDVVTLIEGFEGPYSVELLASTMWVILHDDVSNAASAAEAVRRWTKRKGRIYTDDHVALAWNHLKSRGL